MLPAKPTRHTFRAQQDEQIRPGTWWRLVDADHKLNEMNAPEHGIVLMVQEARIIDGEMHTIILHQHPLWTHAHTSQPLRFLVEDFLKAFTPEPDGEALRESELAAVMGTITAISDEMRTPPEPMLLLERQTEKKAATAAEQDSAKTGPDTDVAPSGNSLPANTMVPAALLPSQDVVEAQKAIETRIAAFEAQKNWITAKTDELKDQMNLVALYQTEKVNTTLASISQETKRASDLLQNVQTMRLFLGEDSFITPLLEGKSADASEPLTFMQRMLYLDEEIFINDLMEGFSSDQVEDLAAIFARDFSLVERMLPYQRCVAITRVRRKTRALGEEKMSIAQLFEKMEIDKADMRIHILVRDGTRVHMITADETTSGATRLFPSRQEIDALFQSRSYLGREIRQITPNDVDYSDARADHDKRALFYKRFLLLFWGAHERTDIFGDFVAKGANWLDATIHSDNFRFIHDEEEVLEDGRPSIQDYVARANAGLAAGSRIVVRWRDAAHADNAPGIFNRDDYRSVYKGVDFREEISTALVFSDKEKLSVKAACFRDGYGKDPSKTIMNKVSIARSLAPQRGRPDRLYERSLESGWLCLDHLELEEVDYYINSRKARTDYLTWLHIFNAARSVLVTEQESETRIFTEMARKDSALDRAVFHRAMRAWRAGNKWGWPETEKQRQVVVKLVRQLAQQQEAATFIEALGALHGGLKANGDIYAVFDDAGHTLPDRTALPWLHERSYGSLRSKTSKSERLVSWSDCPAPDVIELYRDHDGCQATLAKFAPEIEVKVGSWSDPKMVKVPGWRIPRGLFGAENAGTLEQIATGPSLVVDLMTATLDGTDKQFVVDLLEEAFDTYKTSGNSVILPQLVGHTGLVYGIDHDQIPRAWLVGFEADIRSFCWDLGYQDAVKRQIERRYAYPDKVLESVVSGRRGGMSLVAKVLSPADTLKSAYISNPCLSFDGAGSTYLRSYDVPDDAGLGWLEYLARGLAEAENSGHFSRRYEPAKLREAAKTASFIGAPGAEDLTARLFEMERRT